MKGKPATVHLEGLDKCVGTGCDRRAQCIRFRSDVQGQGVMLTPPLKRVSQACAYFHPILAMGKAYMMTPEQAEAWAAKVIAKPPTPSRIKQTSRTSGPTRR